MHSDPTRFVGGAQKEAGRYSLGRALAIVILCFFALASCHRKQAPPPPQPVPVSVAKVIVRDQPIISEYIGQTRGSLEVEVRARVEGFLESIHFQEGLFVKEGDLLYVIDPRPYEAALAQAQGELARAEAASAKARQDVVRFEPLMRRNAISRQQYDEAVATERASEAAVQAAQAVVETARLQLGYTRITAPVDGRIGKSEVQPGNLVGRGQNTLLTTISKIDPIHVRFSISETTYLEWTRANPGEAEGHGPVADRFGLILADGTSYPYKGSIVFADRTVDPATGTLLIEASFPNPTHLLRPGQYVRVQFPTTVVTNAILIPQRAIRELQATYSVVVVSPDQKAEIRQVTPGPRVGTLWVIESGLKPGEEVVVDGQQKVQNGTPLKPTEITIQEAAPQPDQTGNI